MVSVSRKIDKFLSDSSDIEFRGKDSLQHSIFPVQYSIFPHPQSPSYPLFSAVNNSIINVYHLFVVYIRNCSLNTGI